jgi:DNA-binding transcriptional ArsR family regulator
MKPNYCATKCESCAECNLTNYGLDCHNSPIQAEYVEPSKYQQVVDLLRAKCYVPSAITPHLDALESAGLVDALAMEQLTQIVIIAQTAYRNGQQSTGAELIDNDAIWINGIGGLEKQPDGTWKLTMPDKPNAIAATLGRLGGSVKSERKSSASRENGKLGGRPRKEKK